MAYEVAGLVVAFQHHAVLVYGPEPAALAEPLYGPPVYLRPGYRQWEPPAPFLLPHTVVDDIGQEFEAPDVYEWLETQGDLYPRSDVIGYRLEGGEQSVFTKNLDLTDLAVFASARPDGGPFVRVSLGITAQAGPAQYALTPAEAPVPLLARALPCYRLASSVMPRAAAGGGERKGRAAGAAILSQLLASGRRDWRLTLAELEALTGGL